METERFCRDVVDGFQGSAVGTFVGDALGMPVEGWSRNEIRRRFGTLAEMEAGRFPRGRYTDDTEMMISILECLAEHGRFDPAWTARRFAETFDPGRGYGARIHDVMARIRKGVSWDRAGTDSYGNGGAMRIAPIGFFHFRNPDRLHEAAADSCRITHTHPEALAGAIVQASAVAMALGWGLRRTPVDSFRFFTELAERAADVHRPFALRLLNLAGYRADTAEEFADRMTALFACDVKAIEAVPPALAAFATSVSFEDAVTRAVNLGGDTDTIGAMTGAVAGAYYGLGNIPRRWLDCLENGPRGRDYVLELAARAAGHLNDAGKG